MVRRRCGGGAGKGRASRRTGGGTDHACKRLQPSNLRRAPRRQAMNAGEAHQMLAAARACPDLTAQLVPSPLTLAWDAAVQDIVKSGRLGRLTYISVRGVGGGGFPDPPGAPLQWRQNADYRWGGEGGDGCADRWVSACPRVRVLHVLPCVRAARAERWNGGLPSPSPCPAAASTCSRWASFTRPCSGARDEGSSAWSTAGPACVCCPERALDSVLAALVPHPAHPPCPASPHRSLPGLSPGGWGTPRA